MRERIGLRNKVTSRTPQPRIYIGQNRKISKEIACTIKKTRLADGKAGSFNCINSMINGL